MSRMYRERKKSINAWVGCLHECTYCVSSFQRQMKRQKNRCLSCYNYEPHFHPERLLKAPPRTVGKEFIFFPSSGDLAFTNRNVVMAHIDYAEKYRDRTFLIQTKNPVWFSDYTFPENVILGTTIESNQRWFFTPSKYREYREISKAPEPFQRYRNMMMFHHKTKDVTIEPVLDFNIIESIPFTRWIERISETCETLIVYLGYDNHNCKLPEPPLAKTEQLITELARYPKIELRKKTIRKAWYE